MSRIVRAAIAAIATFTAPEALAAGASCDSPLAVVTFERDAITLGRESSAVIGEFVDIARSCGATSFEVVGYRSMTEGRSHPELSGQRSQQIRDELVARGVPATQITVRDSAGATRNPLDVFNQIAVLTFSTH